MAFLSTQVSASPDRLTTSICESISKDNKKRLRQILKANSIRINRVYETVSCNEQNILVFAAQNKALKTGTVIIKYSRKLVVLAQIEKLEARYPALATIARTRAE